MGTAERLIESEGRHTLRPTLGGCHLPAPSLRESFSAVEQIELGNRVVVAPPVVYTSAENLIFEVQIGEKTYPVVIPHSDKTEISVTDLEDHGIPLDWEGVYNLADWLNDQRHHLLGMPLATRIGRYLKSVVNPSRMPLPYRNQIGRFPRSQFRLYRMPDGTRPIAPSLLHGYIAHRLRLVRSDRQWAQRAVSHVLSRRFSEPFHLSAKRFRQVAEGDATSVLAALLAMLAAQRPHYEQLLYEFGQYAFFGFEAPDWLADADVSGAQAQACDWLLRKRYALVHDFRGKPSEETIKSAFDAWLADNAEQLGVVTLDSQSRQARAVESLLAARYHPIRPVSGLEQGLHGSGANWPPKTAADCRHVLYLTDRPDTDLPPALARRNVTRMQVG